MLSTEVFSQGMLFLATIYEKIERITTDGAIAKLWYNSLKDLDDDAFQYAVEAIAKTSKFAPSIAEIREKAWEYKHPDILTAEQAWEIIYNDLHKYGFYKQPTYDNPILERAKNAISWEALCNVTTDQVSILRRQFIDIYKSLMETQKYAEVTNNGPKLKSLEELSKRLAQSKSFKQLGGGDGNKKAGDEDL
ncbi:MAG: hypothetical protein GX468_09335 [Thermotogaceae bacterium]|nr:hypothetical protein [Thermotogaceae bacterium]